MRTALSLGRDRKEIAPSRLADTRLSGLLPMRRVRACGASGVAVHQRPARANLLITDRPRRAVALRAERHEERSLGYPSH
ncbi:hypothetical protein [Streptomyces sp. NPDC058307]|uniref:hypothetical protein n=1 Tax=Streptomyces sp. NPDC058307 TaxID=3346439 RepID=UPI0036E00FCF